MIFPRYRTLPGWIILAVLLPLTACGARDNATPAAAGVPPLETIVPPEGLPGWSVQLEAVLGDARNEAVHFEVRVGPGFWNLLFPSNGVLPGMHVRVSGRRRVLVDPATSRYARLTGQRQDFLGMPDPLPASFQVRRPEDGPVRIRYTLLHPADFSSWHELELVPDPMGSGPTVGDLAGFITAPLPVRLPQDQLDLRISEWTWRSADRRRTGFSRFRILRAERVAMQREDLIQDFPKYSLRPLPDLLPGADRADFPGADRANRRKGVWVQSTGPMGILFVDAKMHSFLPLKRPVYLGPRESAEVMVVPLLGGVPGWKGTVRGLDVWTIAN
ncbi:MAG: hypothetical protein CVU65_15595 [Deltaproteobacteria bacterium HGW-Deltaproteobacteria-22]|jgi:hypothetical protein|nr:MAG: hypothetical protein CVU65_15595 [Deltaproteobacteria bacterium HGW-Deltaproteobacteria-22]